MCIKNSCAEKPKSFINNQLLSTHQKNHDNVPCIKCRKTFGAKRNLLRHIKIVHKASEDEDDRESQNNIGLNIANFWLHQCWHEGFVNNASWTIASWPIASWPIDPNHCASNWLVNIKRYYLLFFGRKFSFLDLLIFATIGISFHFAGMTGILSTVSIHLFWKFTSGAPRNLGAPWSKILESFWADEPLS